MPRVDLYSHTTSVQEGVPRLGLHMRWCYQSWERLRIRVSHGMPWTSSCRLGLLHVWFHSIVLSLSLHETNTSPGLLPAQYGQKAGSPVLAIQDGNENGFLQYQHSKLSRFPRPSDISEQVILSNLNKIIIL